MTSRKHHHRLLVYLLPALLPLLPLRAQNVPSSGVRPAATSQAELLERLAVAVDQAEAKIKASQAELDALKEQLRQMRSEIATGALPPTQQTADTKSDEQVSLEESQIATLDQIKVESVSKVPLRVSGTILLNGFFNTGHVDQTSAPTTVLANGNGSAGLSVRQTVLGLDSEGPHLFGAASHADLRVDFFGNGVSSDYNNLGGLLRLRTAHASLGWPRTQVFFSLDRPIINPEMPESLVSVAQPELAWSGNLWSWNPQLGVTQTVGYSTRLRMQAAVIDPGDPVIPSAPGISGVSTSDLAKASQRPGVETRLALLGKDDRTSPEFGLGGYFSPHILTGTSAIEGSHFDSWAATADYRAPLKHQLVLSGSVYRGQALGGLGGGAYKDYVSRLSGTTVQLRPLDDVGGWSQLHQTVSLRVQWNAGFGIDNGFANELRAYPGIGSGTLYRSIARNRTFFGNVIYSPRSSLLFSLEYRNLYTAPVSGDAWTSNTTGLGAAYRF